MHVKILDRIKGLFWLRLARRDRYENTCLYWAERRVSATLTKHGFENGTDCLIWDGPFTFNTMNIDLWV